MPILTLPLTPLGPVVDITVGLSVQRVSLLQKSNQAIPSPIQLRGLIDTGANVTCIEAQALQPLGLLPIGIAIVNTPMTAKQSVLAPQYDVSLTITHPHSPFSVPTLAIAECQPLSPYYQALLARDVLARCLFVYDGSAGTFTLAF
jgi:hypothetical protein